MDGTDICAVIVSYHSPEDVASCLGAIVRQVGSVVVVDNSNDVAIKQVISERYSPERVSLICNESNEGLAAALNQGIRFSIEHRCRWTLFLDQDSLPSEGMVSEMLESYGRLDSKAKQETAMIVSTVLDERFNEIVPAVVTTKFLNRKVRKPAHDCFVHFHITSGSLIMNEAIKETGLMNEHLFIDYVDFDYCFRLLDRQYRILLSAKALLFHALGEKRRKLFLNYREHTPLRVYYQTRNRLYMIFRYGQKYRSFMLAESLRCISKFVKIIILESDKKEKIRLYGKGIRDFVKDYQELEACSR